MYVYFYVSYFCLVDVRLKQDTLRLIPLETILEWELALVEDSQLVRNNNGSIVFVIYLWCWCFLVHKLLKKLWLHWTEVISSHHTIFAPVQKVKIALTKFKFYKKVQGFVKTLQIISFQNDG